MRLFYALDFDDASRDALAGTLRRLAHDPPRGVRVVPLDSLHLTLKFMGHVEAASLPLFAAPLEAVAPGVPARAPTHQLTGFPRASRAHVAVLELTDPGGALAAVARALDAAAAGQGVETETRPFRPHVTLARARDGRDVGAWLARVTPPPELSFASLTLYESRTLPTGPLYTPRARALLHVP